MVARHQPDRPDVPCGAASASPARVLLGSALPAPASQIPVCASNLGGSQVAPRACAGGRRGRRGRCSWCSTGDVTGSQGSGGIGARIGRKSCQPPRPSGRPVDPSADGAWSPRGLATQRARDRRRTAVRRGGRSSPMTGCSSGGNQAARQASHMTAAPRRSRSPRSRAWNVRGTSHGQQGQPADPNGQPAAGPWSPNMGPPPLSGGIHRWSG